MLVATCFNRIDIAAIETAFTTPEHITQWNFASDDWCCPSAKFDLSIGGKYTAHMAAKDGSVGFDFAGVYEEVEPVLSGDRMSRIFKTH